MLHPGQIAAMQGMQGMGNNGMMMQPANQQMMQ